MCSHSTEKIAWGGATQIKHLSHPTRVDTPALYVSNATRPYSARSFLSVIIHRVWEVVRTVAALPLIVVKCGGVVLRVVLRVVICGVVLVVSCVVCRVVLFLLCVCVCGLFLFLEATVNSTSSSLARSPPS